MKKKILKKIAATSVDLNEILEKLRAFHSNNEDSSSLESIDEIEADFNSWYYKITDSSEGFSSITELNSFQFLKSFYDKFFERYGSYFELINSPIKKSFFSTGVDKRSKELDKLFKRTENTAEKLFVFITVFTEKIKENEEQHTENGITNDIDITENTVVQQEIIESNIEEPKIEENYSEIDTEQTINTIETLDSLDFKEPEQNSFEEEPKQNNDEDFNKETSNLEKSNEVILEKEAHEDSEKETPSSEKETEQDNDEDELEKFKKMLKEDFEARIKSIE